MKNILYIGPYREFSGMGNAARQYIEALLLAGHNVSIKPIYNIFKPYPEDQINPEVLELENNSSRSYDIVFQHTFPHQYCYDHRFAKNIGVLHLESFYYHDNLLEYLNVMDEIVVGSKTVVNSIRMVGEFDSPIHIIPEPINLNNLEKYKKDKEEKDTFSFYSIGDFIPRKNLQKLIMAFILAFDKEDNIDLVIKTKNYSNENTNLEETIEYELGKIYKASKLANNNVKKPKIMIGETNYANMMYLHANNDCFINPSMGESFGFSTLEALAFNNNIIVNKNIGSADIIDNNCGSYIQSNLVSCNEPENQYYWCNSIRQQWFDISIDSLVDKMIQASQETKQQKEERIRYQKDKIGLFSMQNISERLKSI